MTAIKHKRGAKVRIMVEFLGSGNREYWRKHGGDCIGVVSLRNGVRCQVTLANGLAGWFDDADLEPLDETQGVLL